MYGEERIFKRRRSRPEPSPGPLRDGERREVLPPPWIREATQTFGLILPKVSSAFLQREAPVDTKARQENEQLKAHVAELVKESGDLGNRVDALTQENAALKQENEQLKRKAKTKKTKKSKHRQHTSNGQ